MATNNSTVSNDTPESERSAMNNTDNAMVSLTGKDIDDVTHRLHEVIHSLRAIHQMSIDATMDESLEFTMIAIGEMARANVKGIDACLERIGGCSTGNFASEFE